MTTSYISLSVRIADLCISLLCFSIKYQSLNDNNSEEFHASFVLELCKPLPAAVEVVHKIYEVLNKAGKMLLGEAEGLPETLGGV